MMGSDLSLKKKGIRSDVLKLIAMICMLIDHTGSEVISRYLDICTDYSLYMMIHKITEYMCIIGRIAFPIFCYQLVVGFYKTSDRRKMCIRLFIFALISEIPFDLLINNRLLEFKYQNVFFTLFFGYLAIWALNTFTKISDDSERADSFGLQTGKNIMFSRLVGIIAAIAMVGCGFLFRTDYNGGGVILIIIFYLVYENMNSLWFLPPCIFFFNYFLICIFYRHCSLNLAVERTSIEMYSIIGFGLVYFDNGKRLKNKKLKWIGYVFYPLHLLILYFIKSFIFGF